MLHYAFSFNYIKKKKKKCNPSYSVLQWIGQRSLVNYAIVDWKFDRNMELRKIQKGF
jgi:hypothetical protein